MYYLIGNPDVKSHVSAKTLKITILFTAIVIVTAYSANLTSHLSIKTLDLPFHDMESLYYKTNFRIGSVGDSSYEVHYLEVFYLVK